MATLDYWAFAGDGDATREKGRVVLAVAGLVGREALCEKSQGE
jgi:hypothetical protein